MIEILIKVAEFVVIFIIGWALGPFLKNKIIKLSKNVQDQGVITFIGSSISVIIRVVFVVIALASVGVDISIIVGSFSALGLGISLALKDNMANVAAGLQILFTKPFQIGDYIQVDESEGVASRIEVMYTTLTTVSNQEVILPNSMIINREVINYSKNKKRRIHIQVPMSLKSNPDVLCGAFKEVVLANDKVLKEEDINVVIEKFDRDYYILGIFCWTSIETYWDALYELNQAVQNKKLEMNIPVPSRMIGIDK